jgi:hypothetical protein
MSRTIVDEETYAAMGQSARTPEESWTLLNGGESTEMGSAELKETLFDMVTSNVSTHFAVTKGDATTFVRVTRGLRG